MPRRTLLALLLLVLAAPLAPADKPAAQWVVVTAPAYRKAVEPLCEQRKGQGLRVEVVQTTDVLSEREVRAGEAEKLCERVVKLCRDFKGTSYVLLVGAVEAGDLADAGKKVAPALPGTAGRMKGQPSDNGYGSPGDGLLPAVAVGRLPARSEDEARQMVRKTLDYEKDDGPGRVAAAADRAGRRPGVQPGDRRPDRAPGHRPARPHRPVLGRPGDVPQPVVALHPAGRGVPRPGAGLRRRGAGADALPGALQRRRGSGRTGRATSTATTGRS